MTTPVERNLATQIAALERNEYAEILRGTKYKLSGYEGEINDAQKLLCGHHLRKMLQEDAEANAATVTVLREVLEGAYEILQDIALADSGDPEQDAFEREVFDGVKKVLGK